jgi:hypothetical protein
MNWRSVSDIFLKLILHPSEQKLQIEMMLSFSSVPSVLNGSFSVIAPVGQTSMQLPHEMQFVSLRAFSIAGFTIDLNPRLTNPKADTFRISEQVRTHFPQLMHLFGSS